MTQVITEEIRAQEHKNIIELMKSISFADPGQIESIFEYRMRDYEEKLLAVIQVRQEYLSGKYERPNQKISKIQN